MNLLAILLVIFSIIKVLAVSMISKLDIDPTQISDIKDTSKSFIGLLILDGLIGIFCGIYILSL